MTGELTPLNYPQEDKHKEIHSSSLGMSRLLLPFVAGVEAPRLEPIENAARQRPSPRLLRWLCGTSHQSVLVTSTLSELGTPPGKLCLEASKEMPSAWHFLGITIFLNLA